MAFKVTLATLHEATAQQVFDQVARHLLAQGKRSRGSGDSCLYRGPDGLKCAAGCLIDDLEYLDVFEDYAWDQLVDANRVPKAHENLIALLQALHDCEEPESWPEALRGLALYKKLSPAAIDEWSAQP